jgi:hypothetical protein
MRQLHAAWAILEAHCRPCHHILTNNTVTIITILLPFKICDKALQVTFSALSNCLAVRFPPAKMRQFVSKLHAAGQSWVPIVDPAVTIDATFRAYVDGTKDKIWMRDHKGKTYVGQVS